MKSPIIVALDLDSDMALELAKKLNPLECQLKVGSQLFTQKGPEIIKQLRDLDFKVFLDLKFHDIPNTVKSAIASSAELDLWMVNVHSLGGGKMLESSVSALKDSVERPLLIGVTVLTSQDQKTLEQVGFNLNLQDQVIMLAKLCKEKGLDGVVCSPLEISLLRKNIGKDFLLVTPGIRSYASSSNDQIRTSDPLSAINDGADYIVIGREVTLSKDPAGKVSEIIEKISL